MPPSSERFANPGPDQCHNAICNHRHEDHQQHWMGAADWRSVAVRRRRAGRAAGSNDAARFPREPSDILRGKFERTNQPCYKMNSGRLGVDRSGLPAHVGRAQVKTKARLVNWRSQGGILAPQKQRCNQRLRTQWSCAAGGRLQGGAGCLFCLQARPVVPLMSATGHFGRDAPVPDFALPLAWRAIMICPGGGA
jgi:hypothetical protein